MPRLEPKLRHEKQSRSNRFIEVDIEERDVPMHRAYGKTRKFNPRLEKLKENVLRGVLLCFLFYMSLIGVLILYVILAFSDVMAFCIATPVTVALLLILTRTPRKRMKFLRNLKSFCKKNQYTLTFNRRFFTSFLWENDAKADFTLKTRTHTYFVKFATAAKRNSDFIFLSKSEILYRKLRLNNKFTVAFNLQPKIKKLTVSFPAEAYEENATAVILLNPVPRDITIKDKDGSTTATGDGENRFGYSIYGGTGFLDAVARNENNTNFIF